MVNIQQYLQQQNRLETIKKQFEYLTRLCLTKELSQNKEEIVKKLAELLQKAVDNCITGLKELPKEKQRLAILFSGGVDSSTLALIANKINIEKKLGIEIILYTAAFSDGNTRTAPDLEAARKAAKSLKLILCESIVSLKETEGAVPEIIKIINSADPVKVGVALPFYFCAKKIIQSRKDSFVPIKDNQKIKDNQNQIIVLSGLGSEELFAGYQRHADVLNQKGYNSVNQECLNGLKGLWERDLLRDTLIALHFGIKLKVPFLDGKLIEYSLSIPAELKITQDEKKIILRESAVYFGLPRQFAWRKKVAAQYGSNFDKALEKLAKKAGMQKGEYLKNIRKNLQ